MYIAKQQLIHSHIDRQSREECIKLWEITQNHYQYEDEFFTSDHGKSIGFLILGLIVDSSFIAQKNLLNTY
jgi:hypothetical protein